MSEVNVVKMIDGIRPSSIMLYVIDHKRCVLWHPIRLNWRKIHACELSVGMQIGHCHR